MVKFKYRDTCFSFMASGEPSFSVFKGGYRWSALHDERKFGFRFNGYELLCRKGLEKW